MPRGDGTGPMGYGPMTGRAAGYCAGFGAPGYMSPAPGGGLAGRGFWGRRGGVRGWRNRFYATGLPGWARGGWNQPGSPWGMPPATAEQELQSLQEQSRYFSEALEDVKKRIDELSREKKS